MSGVRTSHLLFGVGLVVMGYALVVIAFAKQAERPAELTEDRSAVDTQTSPAPEATQAPRGATAAPSAASAAGSGETAGSASVGGAEVPVDAADVRLFRFSPGGAVMSRDEVQRLMAFGKLLARRPAIKVFIEAFGDLPGSEPVMVGIAKHRAKVAQMLLAKAGVSEDRMTSTVVDMGSDVRLARTIRVATNPPLSDTDKP
jgi:outer membrane protein OmpA-like peptidoglycan-associated protein